MIGNYIDQNVQIIYNDRNRNISIRNIRVISVRDGKVKAYCFTAKGPRVFNEASIIDVELVRYAG